MDRDADREPAAEPRWRRCESVLSRHAIDVVVILPAGAAEPVSLAGTGALVWDLLAEPASLSELVATFTEVYPDDPGTIARDVAALLESLKSLDAIEAV
jgi:hypothetical protein